MSHDGTEAKNNPSSSAISKQKSITNMNRLPSPPPKKNKKEDIKLNDTFATLFGSPIQPSKLPLTTSKSITQKLSTFDKSQVKVKSSPHHKEEKKDKDKDRDKEKKKFKESSAEKIKKDKDKKEKIRENSDKSKSLKQSSSKPDKKESTHHEKTKDKSIEIKIEKKESKDKSKREDKVKEKKEKSHKEEKSYHETKIIKQEIKTEFNDQEKKKHKSSPESIKVKSDKKLEKSEKTSKPHKSHKEHKKRDKRDKEEKLIKKEEKSNFVEQETSFKHLDISQNITSIDEFPKVKDEMPDCSLPPKANSSRVHDPESEDEFLSEDSELIYQQPEPPKPKEPEPPKKKLSPENNFTKKKKRKKKDRDTEEPKQKISRPEITERLRETCSDVSRSPSPSPSSKFTDEYINSLKHLQHKIMLLEDEDLQRVVTVIAETGHYEITTKTFDFDLCALNETTVKKLQELIT